MSKKKIAIAIHSFGPVDARVYSNHIAMFASWSKNYECLLMTLDRAKVAEARNALVERALEENCTHVLFLDTDHFVDKEMLGCLLGNTDAAVVSGLVVRKDKQRSQVCFVRKDDLYFGLELPTDGMSYSVDACAFGCTLVNLDVFKNIEKPWFKDTVMRLPNGELRQRRSDMNFCDDVKAQGKIIRVDTRVLVGHLANGEVIYPPTKEYQVATYQIAAEVICKHNLSSVIDLGCGFARKLVKYIEPICKVVTAVDNEDCISYCKSHYSNIEVDFKSLDFETGFEGLGKYGLVICADVLEHLDKPKALFRTIKSCMTDDSFAVLSTPDAATIAGVCISNPGHKQFWSKDEFVELVKANELDVVDVKYKKEFSGYMSTICICRKGS